MEYKTKKCKKCNKNLYRYNQTGFCYKHSRLKKGDKNSGQFKKGESGYWKDKKRKPFSAEWINRLKISRIGKKPMLGKRHSPEAINKIRISMIKNGHYPPAMYGKDNPFYGKKHSQETLKKMCEVKKGKWSGNKNPKWNGGITPERNIIRGSSEIKIWRKSVFERDNYTCRKYGTRGGDLVSHHINNFSEFPELRFDIDNGITLSKKAHKEFHKIYGIKNNTQKQLDAFINY